MSILEPQQGEVPHATPSATTEPFWEGCALGELRYQRCATCSAATFPPSDRCRACHSDALKWEVSAGRGTVYSWTMVWRPVVATFTTPYAVAIVELDEGYQMISNIVGCRDDQVASGMRVAATFHSPTPGFSMVCFRPEGDEG